MNFFNFFDKVFLVCPSADDMLQFIRKEFIGRYTCFLTISMHENDKNFARAPNKNDEEQCGRQFYTKYLSETMHNFVRRKKKQKEKNETVSQSLVSTIRDAIGRHSQLWLNE